MRVSLFAAEGDPDCKHRSHYECVVCRKLFCARCGAEMALSSDDWKAISYWCPDCRDPRQET
jgi:hypothetical protein